MNARYQVTIASAGTDPQPASVFAVNALVVMGHFPIDLSATGVLGRDPKATIDRHIARGDYLMLVLGAGAGSDAHFRRLVAAHDTAVAHAIPILAVTTGAETESQREEAVESLLLKIKVNPTGMVETVGEGGSLTLALSRFIDTHERRGWVSAEEASQGGLATDLVQRLTAASVDPAKRSGVVEDVPEDARLEAVRRTLEENRILIPLWSRGGASWEKPIEMSLYDFFVRLAPEMVVERSVADAAEFIPIGVCDLDPNKDGSGWVVPSQQVNLWFTDLMALGLVEPSTMNHAPKDNNQYWTLTAEGRALIAEIRREVLETGGHRHVGFTSEFQIPG